MWHVVQDVYHQNPLAKHKMNDDCVICFLMTQCSISRNRNRNLFYMGLLLSDHKKTFKMTLGSAVRPHFHATAFLSWFLPR